MILYLHFVPLHWQDSAELIYIKSIGQVRVDMETYPEKTRDVGDLYPTYRFIVRIRKDEGHF